MTCLEKLKSLCAALEGARINVSEYDSYSVKNMKELIFLTNKVPHLLSLVEKLHAALDDCKIYVAAASINSDGRNPVQKSCRNMNEALSAFNKWNEEGE